MKTIESFTHEINDIFRELEMASQISIDCIAENDTCLEKNAGTIRVVAVNGTRTPGRFLRRMKRLKDEAIENFEKIFEMIDPDQQEEFVDQALCRAEQIRQTVMFTGYDGSKELITHSVSWTTGKVNCYLGDDECTDTFKIAEAIMCTRKYAWIYYAETYRVEEFINSYVSDTTNLPVDIPDEYENIPGQKVMVNWPVPVVCAMMRIFYDSGRLGDITLPELSYWISENFFTSLDESLDPEVILDLIENPSPEAIEELKVKLQECEEYTKKLIHQLRWRFKMASAYAKAVLADPARSAVLAARVRPGRSILRLAIQEYNDNNPF